MADFVEKTGKTVEEAIEAALFALHLPKERCTVEILEEPSNGFFGLIGKRAAKVRVIVKEEPLPSQQEFRMQEEQETDVSESPAAPVEEERREEASEQETLSTQRAPARDMPFVSREDSSRREASIADHGFSYAPSREERSFSAPRRERFSSVRRSFASDSSSVRSRSERVRASASPANAEASLKKAEDFLQQIFQAMELDVAIERSQRPRQSRSQPGSDGRARAHHLGYRGLSRASRGDALPLGSASGGTLLPHESARRFGADEPS